MPRSAWKGWDGENTIKNEVTEQELLGRKWKIPAQGAQSRSRSRSSRLSSAEEFSGRGEPRGQALIAACVISYGALAIRKVWSNGKCGKLARWLENQLNKKQP